MDSFDFVNRANADYIERLYQSYTTDPRLVEERWRAFFAGFDLGNTRKGATPVGETGETVLSIEIADLVHSYRELGHFVARLDPLGHNRPNHPLLELSEFGLSVADLDRQVGHDGFLKETDGTLRTLVESLRTTYCSSIGVEYMSIPDKTQREWLQQRMEPILNRPGLSAGERRDILCQVVCSQGFEEFLGSRYVGQKRFSLEGGESLIPLLNTIVEDGAALGVDEVVMGSAHRGRLNILAHVLKKPFEIILSEFEGTSQQEEHEGDGDVKYHLGYSSDRVAKNGKKVHVSLSFNPSHLELVNPVVEGIVRAKQYYLKDSDRKCVIPLLIHGEAAFCGQGIVQETLALSEMPFWRTGGTIHVIINNQIGFTTMPKQGRFTPYPTDVAKMIQAPIFHVNGDDPEAVVHVAKMAIAFRQKFHSDVFIDLWCYRRHGHNETDEPSFTQPLMYKEIEKHPRLRESYSQKLVEQAVLSAEDVERMKNDCREALEKAQASAKEVRPRQRIQSLGGVWKGMSRAGSDWSAKTNVPAEAIQKVAASLVNLPPGFTVHPKLRKMVQNRIDMAYGKHPIDWGGAEMFAIGSLVLEGTPVRFVGQDAQRGTFSHRHACLHDYNNGHKYYPLASLSPRHMSDIIIVNTMLSELAVLAFEYGFASADPRNFVAWEAQFGDFVNQAQPVIDQFIAAAESKWQKMCGLVMLLPHGYEGQGPEHSNAYMERFLALCAENNLQVCVPSTPGQYFHLLRRQMKRAFRKPLVCLTPKSLLRLEASSSSLAELTDGQLQLVIDDPKQPGRDSVRRLVLCSGKVYFALEGERDKQNIQNVAIVRVEQLYPFPTKEIQGILAKYRQVQEVCWVQEEPHNRGAWAFMRNWLEPMLPDPIVLTYVGREDSASPATGSYKVHGVEEREIISHALELPAPPPQKVERRPPPREATPVSD